MIITRLDLEGGHRYVRERVRGGYHELEFQRRNPDAALHDRIETLRAGLPEQLDAAQFSTGDEREALSDHVQFQTGRAIALERLARYPAAVRELFSRYKACLDFCMTGRYVSPQDVELVFDPAEEDATRRAWEMAASGEAKIGLMRGAVARNRTDAKLFIGMHDHDETLLREAAYEGSLDAQYELAVNCAHPVESDQALYGAARQGHTQSQAHLGALALDGNIDDDERLEPTERYERKRQALAYLHRSADAGNSEAQHRVAIAYLTGIQVPRDSMKAVSYLRRAAESGSIDAQFDFALLLTNSAVRGDLVEAFTFFARAAHRGSAPAQAFIGKMYRDGKVVAPNWHAAQEWFEKAALQQNADGQYGLAALLRSRGETAATPGRMRELCEASAAQGNTNAQRLFAEILRDGYDGAKDPVRAGTMYLHAAEGGDAEAQFVIALEMLEDGNPNRDAIRGMAFLEDAAEQNYAKAQAHLAYCYANGKDCVADPNRAFKLAHAAAMRDNLRGQLQLAKYYRTGFGIEKNDAFAFRFMRKAAESDLKAMAFLGGYYLHGIGCEPNATLAFASMKRSAESGLASAQFELAHMYAKGIGCSANRRLAFTWYETASMQGENRALARVGQCYLFGQGVDKNEARALECLQEAAAENAQAAYLVGFIHERGLGVPAIPQFALEWYRRAAEKQHVEARYKAATLLLDGVDAMLGQAGSDALARTWLELPEMAEHAPGIHTLARLYRRGCGGPVELEKVLPLLEKSATGGHVPAIFDVGFNLRETGATAADRERGLGFIRTAAEGGYGPAQVYLGKYLAEVEPQAKRRKLPGA